MSMTEAVGEGVYTYTCTIACKHPGRYGFTARVTPQGDLRVRTTPLMVAWT
jgi:starch phosphorylase